LLFATYLDVIIVRYVCIDVPRNPTVIVYDPVTAFHLLHVRKLRKF